MAVQKSLTNQVIALAGIAQVSSMVQALATTGKTDTNALEISVYSVLQLNPKSILEVYQGLPNIHYGLKILQTQITGFDISNTEQARYSTSLVYLESRLAKNPTMKKSIVRGIEKAQLQAEHFEITHDNILANLGDLYTNTISTISPRIMVNGDPQFLQQAHVVNRIRTLLLAGVRSAMLWRQYGGSRLSFLFHRKKMQDEVKFLLSKT
ncbi:MAG: high frequency lysogenization protein HflD [Methylococcales bacterium]|nr:high frequency lysogenization protein HflD [Methylococcales bacterium]